MTLHTIYYLCVAASLVLNVATVSLCIYMAFRRPRRKTSRYEGGVQSYESVLDKIRAKVRVTARPVGNALDTGFDGRAPWCHLLFLHKDSCPVFRDGDAVQVIGKTYTGPTFGDDMPICPFCHLRNRGRNEAPTSQPA